MIAKIRIILFSIFVLFIQKTYQINIINQKENDYSNRVTQKENIEFFKKGENTMDKSTLKSTMIDISCTNLLNTYHALGEESFSSYKYCKQEYALLLGKSDEYISTKKPFCYESLSSIFCNNYLSLNDQTEKCISEQLTTFIIDLIRICLKSKSNLNNPNHICSSLDIVSYKIDNPKLFCQNAKTKTLIESNSFEDKYEIKQIKEDLIPDCITVVDKYNLCIEADDYLYLNEDNYDQCFNPRSSIYDGCLTSYKFDDDSRFICQNYILPSLATLSLDQNLFNQNIGNLCFNYKDNILNLYDQYLFDIQMKFQNYNYSISSSNNMIKNNSIINRQSEKTLEMISNINKLWRKIFDFGKNKNIKVSSQYYYDIFIKDFESIFKFSMQLDKYVNIQNNLEENNNNLNKEKISEVIDLYSKTEFSLLKLNKDLKQLNGINKGKNNYEMDLQKGKELDVKYSIFISNIKKFLNFGVEFSKNFNEKENEEISFFNYDIEKLKIYEKKIKKFKENFKEFLKG